MVLSLHCSVDIQLNRIIEENSVRTEILAMRPNANLDIMVYTLGLR